MMCSLWSRIQDITPHLMVMVESDGYQNQLKCVLVDHNTKSISDEPHLQGNVQSLVEEDKLVEGSSVVEKKMEEEVHIEEEEKVADNTTSINLHSKV